MMVTVWPTMGLHPHGGSADDQEVDPSLLLAAAATFTGAAALVVGTSVHRLAGRLAPAGGGHLDAMVDAAGRQTASMARLADMSAESIRLATGSFVYELRDRFDACLPPPQVGVASTAWAAPGELAGEPVEAVVFHPGDRALVSVTLALSQAPARRHVRSSWTQLDAETVGGPVRFTAHGGHARADGTFELPSDYSLFIDLAAEVQLNTTGHLVGTVDAEIVVTDDRPEGARSVIPLRVHYGALVVDAEEGLGLDAATVEAVLGPETRTYLLDKAENLPLVFPRLRA